MGCAMADSIEIRVGGFDEMRRALADASEAIRVKAVRSALRKAGNVFKASAQAAAPYLVVPTKRRNVGTVKKAIAVRNSRFARQAGDEGVFVGVRPLRGSRQKRLGKAGASNPNDPYYWRFVEFGTKKMSARPFLRPAANKGAEAVKVFMDSVVPQIEKLDAKARNVR